MRKDQLAYSDEAIPNLIIKEKKEKTLYTGKERLRSRGGGREVGRKRKRKEKNHDKAQSRLKYGLLTF